MYTSHGHHIPGTIKTDPEPTTRARCGGPNICPVCSREAANTFHDKHPGPDTIQHDNDLECERHFMLTLWAHGVTKVTAEDILTSLKQAHVRLVRT